MEIVRYCFPSDPAATGYCVFPNELENDELVLFHATPAQNAKAIISDGFKSAETMGTGCLKSVSFAKRSMASLNHAITKRNEFPGACYIFVVRYETLERLGLENNVSDVHDYTHSPPPKIIGYCVLREDYVHT